jgi:hypothetical protein
VVALAEDHGVLLAGDRVRACEAHGPPALGAPAHPHQHPEDRDRRQLPKDVDPLLPAADARLIDPFRIDPHTFPSSDNPMPSQASIVPTPKSDKEIAEVPAPEAFEAARRAAERFRLQSAGRGLSMAVIDGRTYRIGDALESADGVRFVLLEVIEGAAVLGHGEQRIEIRMRGVGSGTAPSKGDGGR